MDKPKYSPLTEKTDMVFALGGAKAVSRFLQECKKTPLPQYNETTMGDYFKYLDDLEVYYHGIDTMYG